jgi:hypothetical protein
MRMSRSYTFSLPAPPWCVEELLYFTMLTFDDIKLTPYNRVLLENVK